MLCERESSRLLPFVYRDMEKKYGQKRSSLKRNARVASIIAKQRSMSSRDYVLLGDIPLPFPLIFIHRHEFHVRVLSTKLHFPDGLTLVQACIGLLPNYVSNL